MKEKADKSENQIPKDLILRSDEVQEVLGHVPHWIVRWGITVITVICIFFFIGSYFFRYQEKIFVKVSIVTSPPARHVFSSMTGLIDNLFIHDGEHVMQKQKLLSLSKFQNSDAIFIESPIEGTVNFVSDIYCGTVVTEGTPLLVIIPDYVDTYKGVMYLSSSDVVRVKTHMEVQLNSEINIESDIAKITGRINNISSFPDKDGNYLVEVEFSNQSLLLDRKPVGSASLDGYIIVREKNFWD